MNAGLNAALCSWCGTRSSLSIGFRVAIEDCSEASASYRDLPEAKTVRSAVLVWQLSVCFRTRHRSLDPPMHFSPARPTEDALTDATKACDSPWRDSERVDSVERR